MLICKDQVKSSLTFQLYLPWSGAANNVLSAMFEASSGLQLYVLSVPSNGSDAYKAVDEKNPFVRELVLRIQAGNEKHPSGVSERSAASHSAAKLYLTSMDKQALPCSSAAIPVIVLFLLLS